VKKLWPRMPLLVALAVAVVALVWPGAAFAVTATDNGNNVTFTNSDGSWTIYKTCVGTDTSNGVGPGYISVFSDTAGYTPVNGVGNGGTGEFNNPQRAGLGIFGIFESRGYGPYPTDWSDTWQVSNRRCASDSGNFGVVSESTPSFGVDGSGTGYYDQDVQYTDGQTFSNTTFWVRYRWRFDDSGVRLYTMVVETCPYGSCGNTGSLLFAKGPKFANNLNGQLSSTRPTHVSTFDSAGKWLGNCSTVSDPANCASAGYECSYTPQYDATDRTGKCFADNRMRTRFDYGSGSTAGGCNTSTQLCFDVVARAYPLSGLDVEPGQSASNWENTSSTVGLDAWARTTAQDTANRATGGSDPCAIEGSNVYNVGDGLARAWEYVERKAANDPHMDAYGVLDKAWDDCTTGYDADALFRTFGPSNEAWGAFFSYSVNAGWSTS
jgi:hypothetical protein